MKLENFDFKKRVKIRRYVLLTCLAILATVLTFFFLIYLSIQLGPKTPFDSFLKKFIITNPYTHYINPLYILLLQFILDWGSIVAILATTTGLLLLYIIMKSSSTIPFAVAFICIAIMSMTHFLSMQHIIFTKMPYPWSLLTWWENSVYTITALTFAPCLNWIFSKYKTYTHKPILFVSIIFYICLSFAFLYFALAIEIEPDRYNPSYLFHQKRLLIPLAIALLCTFPLFRLQYKKSFSFFTIFLLISLIPFCLDTLYAFFVPQLQYYTSLNIALALKFIMFTLPLIGVILDSRMVYYELEFMKDKAHQNIEKKNTFISSLSSELKTPLKSIVGQTQFLVKESDGPLNEKQKLSLSQILKDSFNLSYLIADILDISKIESGAVIYSSEESNLVECIQTTISTLLPKAKEKKLDLHYEGPTELKPIMIDPKRLKQILFHLLDNSLKFTEKGEITVSLEEDNSNYLIHISDTGIGIEDSWKEKIFQPYSKVDPHTQGLGLGLSLVKKFTYAMNGTIDLTSEKNKKTTFTLTFKKNISEKSSISKDIYE